MSLPPVVALEIGTSTVRALIGEAREDGHLMITGLGQCPSRGVRKGEIVDIENALACAKTALKEAEESAQVIINEVHLIVTGGHISSTVNRGTVPVMGEHREITDDDIEHVMDTARAISISPEREKLHTICQHFYVDDEARVINPEGMEGSRLTADMLIVHGLRTQLRNTVKVVRSIPMEVQDVAFSGLCAALGALNADQKESGVLVIDLGGGTSDYVVYARNAIAMAGSMAVGGDHITNDIAHGLRIPISQAERLKEEVSSAISVDEHKDKVIHVPPDGSFPGRNVTMGDLHLITNARMEEIFRMIEAELTKNDLDHTLGGGVVLTGGGAHLQNITELGERVFNLPTHVARPGNVSGLAVATEGPEYAAGVGMIRYGIKTLQRDDRGVSIGSIFKRLFQYR